MLHAKFQDPRPFGSGEEDFKKFYQVLTWRPFCSCDLDNLYILSFSRPIEASCVKFGGFQRRSLTMVDDEGRTDGRRRRTDGRTPGA